MKRIHVILVLFLTMFAVTGHAALNGYAQLYVNGELLDGDVTIGQIGGLDVSSGYIEIYEINQNLLGKAKSAPITIMKRIDQTTPTLASAVAEEKVVSGEVLLFDNDPDTGETRHRFTISLSGGFAVESSIVLPDAFDPQQSNRPPYEYLQIAPASYTLRDEVSGVEYTVGF